MGENSQNIYSGATEILPSGDQAQFPHRTVLTVTQLRKKAGYSHSKWSPNRGIANAGPVIAPSRADITGRKKICNKRREGDPAILEKGEIGLGYFGGNLLYIYALMMQYAPQCLRSQL